MLDKEPTEPSLLNQELPKDTSTYLSLVIFLFHSSSESRSDASVVFGEEGWCFPPAEWMGRSRGIFSLNEPPYWSLRVQYDGLLTDFFSNALDPAGSVAFMKARRYNKDQYEDNFTCLMRLRRHLLPGRLRREVSDDGDAGWGGGTIMALNGGLERDRWWTRAWTGDGPVKNQ